VKFSGGTRKPTKSKSGIFARRPFSKRILANKRSFPGVGKKGSGRVVDRDRSVLHKRKIKHLRCLLNSQGVRKKATTLKSGQVKEGVKGGEHLTQQELSSQTLTIWNPKPIKIRLVGKIAWKKDSEEFETLVEGESSSATQKADIQKNEKGGYTERRAMGSNLEEGRSKKRID